MQSAILNELTGDATLMASLTGGLYAAAAAGEVSRQDTPDAFDANGEIEPCGLLKMGATMPHGPYTHSQRQFFSVYLYERSGYTNVEAARKRIYALLHRGCVSPSEGGCWGIRHTDDVPDQRDAALGCSLIVCRYEAIYRRV